MARNSPDPREAARTLERIHVRVDALNPPVAEFERGTRGTPFQTLVSVLLSSRTRDPVTLAASARLFALAATPAEMAALQPAQVEKAIFPVGFYRQKAARILTISRRLAAAGGTVPREMEALTDLPGVGRKTANLVRALAFGIPAIAVDIHVFRISRRLGWAREDRPERVEEELRGLFPRALWSRINRVLVGFGQTICRPRHPRCAECPVRGECPWAATRADSTPPAAAGSAFTGSC